MRSQSWSHKVELTELFSQICSDKVQFTRLSAFDTNDSLWISRRSRSRSSSHMLKEFCPLAGAQGLGNSLWGDLISITLFRKRRFMSLSVAVRSFGSLIHGSFPYCRTDARIDSSVSSQFVNSDIWVNGFLKFGLSTRVAVVHATHDHQMRSPGSSPQG